MSQFTDSLNAKGIVNIKLMGPDGTLIEERTVPNLVVTNGTNHIAARVAGIAGSQGATGVMTAMAIGATGTTPAAGNTTLWMEVARVRGGVGATGIFSTSVNNNAITYTGTFPAGVPAGATGIQEAGIFNGSTGFNTGDMLCRTTFAPINKGTSDSLVITWTVTIG